jgi:hypothetical protein
MLLIITTALQYTIRLNENIDRLSSNSQRVQAALVRLQNLKTELSRRLPVTTRYVNGQIEGVGGSAGGDLLDDDTVVDDTPRRIHGHSLHGQEDLRAIGSVSVLGVDREDIKNVDRTERMQVNCT